MNVKQKRRSQREVTKEITRMERVFEDRISSCVQTSLLFDGSNVKDYRGNTVDLEPMEISHSYLTRYWLMSGPIEDIVTRFNGPNVGILDSGSLYHPGSTYDRGGFGWEESMCMKSMLYPVLANLAPMFFDHKVPKNDMHYNCLEFNRGIYVPNVIFVDEERERYQANVLVMTPPNFNVYLTYVEKIEPPQKTLTDCMGTNYLYLVDRINYMLSVFYRMGCHTIILGAFGCGRGGQSAIQVANIMYSLLETTFKNSFNCVLFAVPDKDSKNYQGFEYVFGKDGFINWR